MTTAIAFPKDNDLRGMRIEQGENGHFYSPWWTYDWRRFHTNNHPSTIGSHFNMVRAASIAAFGDALKIRDEDIIVTQRETNEADFEWRLSTAKSYPLPKPVLPENRGAIDI